MFISTPVKKLFANIVQQNYVRNVHLARIQCAHSHYDTLQLTQNCSVKEIREAFIKLSKQCHPDGNQGDPRRHSQFVKLNEAYSVLSRPDKRREYDNSLTPPQQHHQQYHHHQHHHTASYAKVHYEVYNWDSEGKRGNARGSEGYYGIPGVKRVSNATIALLCFALASVGVILQAVAIRVSLTFSREHLDQKSHETGQILAKVREDAARLGKERQLELLRERVIRSGVEVPPFDFGKEGAAALPADAAALPADAAALPADAAVVEGLARS
ncbi:dnaJ-like protein 60 [Bacillus rossius redtenbacheri]|uniref:dnaJ-like protein 60 n=1 Tax=Bacillus rossius redtenbacheri TaxID=93214 RepID=UPI002FDE6BC3